MDFGDYSESLTGDSDYFRLRSRSEELDGSFESLSYGSRREQSPIETFMRTQIDPLLFGSSDDSLNSALSQRILRERVQEILRNNTSLRTEVQSLREEMTTLREKIELEKGILNATKMEIENVKSLTSKIISDNRRKSLNQGNELSGRQGLLGSRGGVRSNKEPFQRQQKDPQ